MNPGYTVAEAYRDLLYRAERYIKREIEIAEQQREFVPCGMKQWIADLEKTRDREICSGAGLLQCPAKTEERTERL